MTTTEIYISSPSEETGVKEICKQNNLTWKYIGNGWAKVDGYNLDLVKFARRNEMEINIDDFNCSCCYFKNVCEHSFEDYFANKCRACYTCYECDKSDKCEFAYDEYCKNGDCLLK